MPTRKTPDADPFLSPDEILALTSLPGTNAVWVGGRRPMPDTAQKQDACFWIDIEANEVRGFDLVPHGARRDALLRLLVDAMRAPEEGHPPQRPAAVASDDARVSPFLAPLEIEVRNAPKGLIDQMFEAMVDLLDEEDDLPCGYLAREGVSAATVARFFDAAATLFRRAPWKHAREHELVRIEGLRPTPIFISMDGVDDDEPAVALFERERDARALLDSAADDLHPDALPPHLVLCYEARGVDAVVDEARAQGWKLAAGNAVPVLLRTNEPEQPLAGEADLALMTAALEAVAALDTRPRQPVEVRVGEVRLVWFCGDAHEPGVSGGAS